MSTYLHFNLRHYSIRQVICLLNICRPTWTSSNPNKLIFVYFFPISWLWLMPRWKSTCHFTYRINIIQLRIYSSTNFGKSPLTISRITISSKPRSGQPTLLLNSRNTTLIELLTQDATPVYRGIRKKLYLLKKKKRDVEPAAPNSNTTLLAQAALLAERDETQKLGTERYINPTVISQLSKASRSA